MLCVVRVDEPSEIVLGVFKDEEDSRPTCVLFRVGVREHL